MKILRILSLFALIFVITSSSDVVIAQDSQARGIIVSPQRVMFNGNERTKEIVIANRGNTAAQYRITIVNRKMTETGQLEETETPAENEFFAQDVMSYGPRRVNLGPRGSQKVRIMSRLRGSSEPGEYRSHLLIQEVPEAAPPKNAAQTGSDSLGINIQAIFGVTIPVIIQKGELDFAANISNPQIITENGQKKLKVRVERSGTKSMLGTLKVFTDGEQIGILKNVAVYLSTPHRDISIMIDPEYAEKLSGKEIRVTFGAEESKEDAPDTELVFTAG